MSVVGSGRGGAGTCFWWLICRWEPGDTTHGADGASVASLEVANALSEDADAAECSHGCQVHALCCHAVSLKQTLNLRAADLLENEVTDKIPSDMETLQTAFVRLQQLLDRAYQYVDDVVVRHCSCLLLQGRGAFFRCLC